MKKLINGFADSIRNLFTEEDSEVICVQIPKTFKTKKDQNYMVRKTKNLIIEKTKIV